jgi:DNA modification methylase
MDVDGAHQGIMKTYLRLSNKQELELPAEFRGDDVRFSESLAEYFIQHYSQPGEVVFDPFAGFGTTLRVAERLNRISYGLEFDMRRLEYARTHLQHPDHLLHGDARLLGEYSLPLFDLSLTSPPYMSKNDREDPFTAYTQPGSGYTGYLRDLQRIYAQMHRLMKPEARVVIEAANIKVNNEVTTLAWDIANVIGQVLVFEGEIVIEWENPYGYGYDHSYALVFSCDK